MLQYKFVSILHVVIQLPHLSPCVVRSSSKCLTLSRTYATHSISRYVGYGIQNLEIMYMCEIVIYKIDVCCLVGRVEGKEIWFLLTYESVEL